MSTATLPLKRRSRWNREARVGLLFVLLPVAQFFLFAFGPLAFSAFAGFTDWSSMGDLNIVGFDNFAEIFEDEKFWKSLYNTFYYMLGIPIGMIIALLLAMAMNRDMVGAKTFRVIYYIPVVSSIVAVAILWRWVYNGDFGILNQLLWDWFRIEGPNWMYNVDTVKPGLIAMMVWKGVGFSALLYLAGLQNIPHSYYEAAQIDGANPWIVFRNITMPLINPISFFIVITSVIGGSQLFIEPSIMTDFGGPEYSSATIVYYLWDKAFGSGYRLGYACAVAWILAAIIFFVTALQFKLAPKNENTME